MAELSLFTAMTVYFGYAVLMAFGYIRESWRRLFPDKRRQSPKGYAPLLRDFEDFYTRRLYHRIQDCWNRPIKSVPGAWVDVMERVSSDYNKTLQTTGKTIHSINLASYNYLGFANSEGFCTDNCCKSIEEFGVSTCCTRVDFGTSPLHRELELYVGKYLGKEDAIVFGMGFATNSLNIPAFAQKGSLIVSDSLNHASLVVGARSSGATIRVFKHNDLKRLEQILRQSIAEGQPRTHRPWKKIIIMVEGIYSMEGEIVKLPQIIELKKKYKCYLYLDEAHSIGAVGKSGRGVSEYWGVDTKDIDIMMGTFTKSFGSVGGYIAGSKDMIRYLRRHSLGSIYAASMPPVCVQQALSALKVICGEDGTHLGEEKIVQLRENANFFRTQLVEKGFEVYGDADSPVVPVMLYNPAKMPAFSRECLQKQVAVVVVGFPATSLIESRVRFCLSASHTREDLERALKVIDEIGERTLIKYKKNKIKKSFPSSKKEKTL